MATNPDPDDAIETGTETGLETGARSDTRAGSGSTTRDAPATDGPTTVVPFELQGTRYCVRTRDIVSVLGVALDGSLRTATDPWNAGEVTVEGERIRVVDLARVFSSPTAPVERGTEPQLLVFELDDSTGERESEGEGETETEIERTRAVEDYCAWLVDTVDVVRTVDSRRLTRTRSRAGTRFVTGQVELDGESFIWLDERAVNGT